MINSLEIEKWLDDIFFTWLKFGNGRDGMINLKVKIQHDYEKKNINCIRCQFI